MIKGFVKKISHFDPRQINIKQAHGGGGEHEEEANDQSNVALGRSISATDVGVAPPRTTPVGPKAFPSASSGPSPRISGSPQVSLSSGAPGPGYFPPGVKIMKGPPPNGAVKMMKSSPGVVSSPRQGSISPPLGNAPSFPPGKLLTGPPPPGAKIIAGAPPVGLKMMHGPPPPGAKIIHGLPSPGMARPISPMASGRPQSPVPTAIKSPSQMPASSKMIIGVAPTGSRPISPEGGRVGPSSLSLPGSRTASPTNPPAFRILPNGVKAFLGPPRAGAPLQLVSNTHSGHPTPSPPTKPPPQKIAPKPMREAGSAGMAPAVPASRASTPLIPPQNTSFLLGPQTFPSPYQHLPKPTPLRPNDGTFKVAPRPVAASASSSHMQTSLDIPQPNKVASSAQASNSDQFVFEEVNSAGSDGDDIQFEEATPSTPPLAPRDAAGSVVHRSFSSSASLSLREDPDAATALPSTEYSKPSATAAPPAVAASSLGASSTKTRRTHHSERGEHNKAAKPRDSHHGETRGDNAEKSSGREHRRHRRHRHHHRTRSSDTGDASLPDSQAQLSAPIVGALQGSSVSAALESEDRPSAERPLKGTADALKEMKEAHENHFSEANFVPQVLTPASRSKIAEHFLSMLCPQQYYGKVQKISRIRPFKTDRTLTTGLRHCNSIYVATKGLMPNSYFYPQLRLRDTDGEKLPTPSGTGTTAAAGAVSTPIILYEATPGNMLFAETELDARRLLESIPSANSCFMLSSSAILFKDPEHFVLPVASLNVHWVPYSSPQSEPQCPIHKRELQLFDPYSKELVCALCASRNATSTANFIVIPDILGNPESNRVIQEKLSSQLDEAQQSAKRWVEQHQRVRELCENKKEAIRHQFNLLIEALEAKKCEYTEACEAEFAYAQTDVAREILITDEKVQLLRAATDHLRGDRTRPLFSMQVATIAEGLSAATDLPSRFTRKSLQLPPMSAGLLPNLEGVMSQVLELNPQSCAIGVSSRGDNRSHRGDASGTHSPLRLRGRSPPLNGGHQVEDVVNISQADQRKPHTALSTVVPRTCAPSTNALLPNHNIKFSPSRTMSSSLASRQSQHTRVTSISGPEMMSSPDGASQRRSAAGLGIPSPYAIDAISVPNSTGTSLFEFALHELLTAFTPLHLKRRSPRYIQWAIRVEDPGDWVGLGVGVGNTIDAWEQGSTNDLSHLWIVPPSLTGHVLQLRVSVNLSSGHAKLTVHDVRGKQLDAGEVPQWNAVRPSYPQATFGGHIGVVRMIEVPHLVR